MGKKNKKAIDTLAALKAFQMTYGMTKGAMQDSAMSDIADAKPETDTGFTEAKGEEINAIANAKDADGKPYYDVAGNDKGGYTVSTAPVEGQAVQSGEVNPGTRTSFLGKTVEGNMSEADQDRARLVAMSGVRARFGDPEAALRLKQQARQGDLAELQIKGAERGERVAQQDEEYNNSKIEVGKSFIGNKMRAENEAAMGKYEQDFAAYQTAVKANPANPAAAGMPPQKPAQRVVTGIDMLHDATLMIQNDMKHGKMDPVRALQYQQLAGQVKKEVGAESFKLLHSGDIQGAIKAFESQGDLKVPEGATIEARKGFYEVGGQKVPTNEIVVKLPNGSVQVINGLQGMDALDAADKVIGNNFKGAELAIHKQQVGIAGAGLGLRQAQDKREQATFDSGQGGRDLQSTVATLQLGLANAGTEQEKIAITDKLRAIQSGMGDDKSAPSEVKLARALVRAGVVKDEAAGLKYALHSKDYSPEKIRADIYNSALKTSFNDTKKANETANQAMKDLGYGAEGSQQKAPSAEDIASTAKKYGISEDEVKKKLGLK